MLSWLFGKVTGAVIKSGAEATKAVVEVPKALVETEKARLEVAKLHYEAAARQSLITPATFDDVKKYDPKYRIIKRVNCANDNEKRLVVDHHPELTENALHIALFTFALITAFVYAGWKGASIAAAILGPLFYFLHLKDVGEDQESRK